MRLLSASAAVWDSLGRRLTCATSVCKRPEWSRSACTVATRSVPSPAHDHGSCKSYWFAIRPRCSLYGSGTVHRVGAVEHNIVDNRHMRAPCPSRSSVATAQNGALDEAFMGHTRRRTSSRLRDRRRRVLPAARRPRAHLSAQPRPAESLMKLSAQAERRLPALMILDYC
jgi:hypothetical protein